MVYLLVLGRYCRRSLGKVSKSRLGSCKLFHVYRYGMTYHVALLYGIDGRRRAGVCKVYYACKLCVSSKCRSHVAHTILGELADVVLGVGEAGQM